MRGVLLIALGNPFYGRLAHQLALSIKAVSKDIPIAVVYTDTALSTIPDRNIFDEFISAPDYIHTHNLNKEAWIKSKVFIDELSPFDETIYIDADTIWLSKPIEQLFDKLSDNEFVMQNHGHYDLNTDKLNDKYSQWVKMSDVKNYYRVTEGKYYNIHSEFIYFKKTESIKRLFDYARAIYDTMKIPHMKFAGSIPDELAFAIAMLKSGVYPEIENFIPSYWEQAEKRKLYRNRTTLFDEFYIFSVGGHINNEYIKNCYDSIMSNVWKQMGVRGSPMRLQDKRKLLSERKTA